MVRLLRLYAINFKKLKFDKPLEFPEGTILITGLNEAGKSTILDAILYALYARVIKPPPERGRTRNEDIIAYGAKEARILLEFAIGERKFRVQRIIKRDGRSQASLDEILPDGSARPLASGQEAVTEQIEKLLGGITFNEMVSSTVVAQKELDKLIKLRKDDRKKIINAFLNLESFNTVLESLDERRKALEGTKERIGLIHIERDKLEMIRKELEEFEKKGKRRAELLEENEQLKDKLQQLEREYNELDFLYKQLRKYEEISQEREKLQLEISRKRERLQAESKRREDLVARLKSLENHIRELSDLEDAEETISEIRKVADDVKALRAREMEVHLALQRDHQKVIEMKRSIPIGLDRVEVERRLEKGGEPLWPLIIGSVLTMFGAIVSFSLNIPLPISILLALIAAILFLLTGLRASKISNLIRLQELYAKFETLDHALRNLEIQRQKYTKLREERRRKEERLATLCARIPRYRSIFIESKDEEILKAVETVLQQASSDLQLLKTKKENLSLVEAELAKLPTQEELENLRWEIVDLEKKFKEIQLPQLPRNIIYSKELLERAERRKESIAGEIEECRTKISINSNQAAELEKWLNEHSDVRERFRQQEKKVSELEKDLKIIKKAIDGIQATADALRNRVKPTVQSYMGVILPVLTNGRYKAAIIDEDYNIQVWDPDAGQFRVKEVYSGGTEDQFLLALRLAFALSLIPEVKGQKPEFIFLDEPLGSSDEIRRAGIIDYLKTDLSKKFKQIFIISHVGGLEEHIKNVICLQDGRVIEDIS